MMTGCELAAAMDRYRGLIDDWPAFIAALQAPHVPCVRVNTLRTDRARVAAALAAEGLRPEPISWLPDGYRIRPGTRLDAPRAGANWLYQAGLYQVQEEASMVPVQLLDPQPGEQILDLCAAPGGKTAQIALALAGRGTVIANDRSRKRLAALHNTVSRLGLCNVTMTASDGCRFPAQPALFDRVLVDAPCTAEGTARKHRVGTREETFVRQLYGIQRALLHRALVLTRPGGRVVYSTCTFAPEENEMIVDAVLAAHPGAARVVPVQPLPGLRIGPGLTSWQGHKMSPSVVECGRMWPHHTGTGGFFVAVLERTERPMSDAAGPRRIAAAQAPMPALAHELVTGCATRYGLSDELFADLRVSRSGRYLRLTGADHRTPAGVAVVAAGLAALPAKAAQPRFTTAGALAFGAHANRRVIHLTAGGSARYLRRDPVVLPFRARIPTDRGFWIVRRTGAIALGNARIGFEGPVPVVESHFPNAWLRGPRGTRENGRGRARRVIIGANGDGRHER